MRSWGHLHGDRSQVQLNLQWKTVLWLRAILCSQQNNFTWVSMRGIERDVHPEAKEHFTAVNHDSVREIIRQLEQLGVKKTLCLEIRVKNKERQENSCWDFFKWK